MKKIYKKLISGMLLAVLMVGGLTKVNAYAASETRDWYVYNNDDYTKNPVSLCKFGNYYKKIMLPNAHIEVQMLYQPK